MSLCCIHLASPGVHLITEQSVLLDSMYAMAQYWVGAILRVICFGGATCPESQAKLPFFKIIELLFAQYI